MFRRSFFFGAGLAALSLAGCGTVPASSDSADLNSTEPSDASSAEKVARLSVMITSLGQDVSPEEAARVARIAVYEPLNWAKTWRVTDPPLLHNMKVNNGSRPRGLCNHWADDLQARMQAERIQTLDWHRAIANFDNLRIEHSTLIVSAKGKSMRDGIVLDPWRLGYGRLYFGPVAEDHRYAWLERQKVFDIKRARRARQS